MARLRLGVLISGRGSNLQALLEACAAPDYPAEVALVISNKPNAAGLDHARAAGVPACVIEHRAFPDRASFDAALDAELRKQDIGLVCLAGFMRLLTEGFCTAWHDRLINIHPSLLPAFPGVDVQQRAIDAGVRFSGCTVHFVRAAMDDGPIIIQAAVPVLEGDDADRLAARILEAEHVCYPQAVRWFAEGRLSVTGNQVRLRGAGTQPKTSFSPAAG
jgi:phosphoribosylglycinamide formyltransferase-1